ncbi:MAG: class A beta-lactamase-related serine hydrolase [Candidatus Omnitrophica bacterium]|nr:class A beta-lactamase-related serine hydrolase [Candidatus Omnitrophota bacterium]
MRNKKLYFLIAVGIILISIFLFYKLYNQRLLEKRKVILKELESQILEEVKNFKQKVAIVIVDLKTGYKIILNEKVIFPAASLIKIPIMGCVYCADKEKILDLKQKVILKDLDKTPGSGILKNFKEGSIFSVEELVNFMIVWSDNTATNILIDLLGFDYLNKCFKILGLKDTTISRKILDNKAKQEGKENYTSAFDMSYILIKFYKKNFLNKSISQKCLSLLKQQKIRDRIAALLPDSVVVANKTGLEKGICHDVGIIFGKKANILISVLTSHDFKNSQPVKNFISHIAAKVYYSLANYNG